MAMAGNDDVKIRCLLLGYEIPESRCDVKKYGKRLPKACKKCLAAQRDRELLAFIDHHLAPFKRRGASR